MKRILKPEGSWPAAGQNRLEAQQVLTFTLVINLILISHRRMQAMWIQGPVHVDQDAGLRLHFALVICSL